MVIKIIVKLKSIALGILVAISLLAAADALNIYSFGGDINTVEESKYLSADGTIKRNNYNNLLERSAEDSLKNPKANLDATLGGWKKKEQPVVDGE